MKKSNLIKRLLSYSHEKQSPQRFARYAAMLILLLTLGVGQARAWFTISSTEDIYFDATDQYTRWGLDDGNNLYVKIYYNNDQSSWNIYQMTQITGSKLYYSSSGKGHTEVSGIEFFSGTWNDSKSDYDYSHGTGKIKFNSWSNALDRLDRMCYTNSTATNWDWSGNIDNPPLSTISLDKYSTTTYGGDGSVGDPYLVAVGTTAQVQVTSTKRSSNLTAKYKFTVGESTDGDYTTTTTKQVVASAVNGTTYTASVQGWGYSNSNYSHNSLTSNTVHFRGVNIYSVTYKANGAGSGSVPAVSGTYYASGKNVTLATNTGSLAKTGYSLTGWNTEADGSGDHYALGGTYSSISGDVELYAEWTPDWALYNSTTKLGDLTKNSDYNYSMNITFTAENSTNLHFYKNGSVGYYFGADDPTSGIGLTQGNGQMNWNLVNNRQYASYKITVYSENSGSSWNYRAQQKYILTYDANGATSGSAPSSEEYDPNDAVTTANSSMTKTSFTLTGWNTQANGQGTHYGLNTSNAFNINSNMTLYAEWTPSVPESACVAGEFGTATMTKTTAGSVTTFTYTFYDKAAGTYDFYLDDCSSSAVLKATTGITMSQTGCTSIANSGDANNYFRVVAGSGGDFTITATYDTSNKTINVDVTRVDIDAIASPSWYMIGDAELFTNWDTDNHSYPLNRGYRGISGVAYRIVDFKEYNNKNFKPLKGNTRYGHTGGGGNQSVTTGTQYSITATDAEGTAFKTNGQGIVWCIVDNTNKKFWVQNPAVYHTVSVTNTGSHGTVVLKEDSYGGLTTNKFANEETIIVEIDTTAHYSIASVRLGETNVTMSHSEGTKYVGDVVMPNSDATLTVTYTPWYTVTYGVGTSYTSMGGVSLNKTISSGDYIISGTSMTFTATPELGYKFVGWYSDASCENEVSTDNPYTFSVSSTTTLYAKFAYRDLYIQADWLDWSTALMTQSTVNRAVYTYEIDNVAARETSASSPYNNGYHFRFMNANNGAEEYLAYNYDGVQTPTGSGFLTNSDIHKTDVGNKTIQYNLTHKSKITITLTLKSVDDATKPAVNIAADRYYDIEYTTPSHGSYTIQVGAAGAVSANTEARAGTTITLANSPATGYHFDSWTVAKSAGTVTVTDNQFTMPAEDVTVSASFAATSYDVTLNANTETGSDQTVTATFDASMPTTLKGGSDPIVAPTKTGYTFTGYWDATSSGTKYYNANLSSAHIWDKATTSTLYAQWSARNYTITLTQEGETGYGSAGVGSYSATFDDSMSDIASVPTAATGYLFQGYFTESNGGGTQFTDADGKWNNVTDTIEDGNWVLADDLTLYAYFKNAEIATLPLSTTLVHPWVSAGTKDSIDVEPTLTFTPEGSVHIDYVIQYYDGSTVTDDGLQSYRRLSGDNIRFRAPSAPGSYRLHAILKTGSTLGEGDELDTENAVFVVASNHNVTVRYVCDGKTIRPSDNYSINAIDSTSISAPSIARYTFSHWSASEGITSNTNDSISPKKYVASFDGTITATYVEKPIVYFKDNLGWGDVWVTYDASWNESNGTGSSGKTYHHMTHIEGTDIWYDEIPDTYTENSFANWPWNIAFNSQEIHETYFNEGKVIYRRDFDPYNTFFVPAPDSIVTPYGKAGSSSYQSSVAPDFTDAVGKNYLYTGGYWKRYNSTYSGWSLRGEFNSWEGSNHNFVAESSDDSIFTTSVLLYKNQTKQFRLYKNKMKNGISDAYTNYSVYNITLQNSETARRFTPPGNANNSDCPSGYYHNTTIQSATEGVYVFKIHYTYKGTVELTVDFPMHAGDYEVAYKDNEKTDWHTSGTIDRNATESTRSFFVRTDQTPVINWRKSKTVSDAGAIEWYDWNAVSLGDYTKSGAILESNAEMNGVYNFKFNIADNALSLTDVEKYNGAYYIRTDAAGGKKWADYISDDHYMTYSDYADSNSGFSHYFMKFVGANTNVKFLVANPYSPCISDTLGQGTQSDYVNSSDQLIESANIRFMWNMHDNSLDRAYVGMVDRTIPRSATKFIVLQGQEGMLMDSEGDELNSTNQGRMYVGDNAIEFDDDQSWIYETTVKAKANGKIKIYSRVNGHDHYLVGKSPIDDWTTSDAYDVLINGTGDDAQVIRVIYDFKTGRLMAAWVPSGVINKDMVDLKADIMIKRKHQESATSFSIAAGKKITLDEEKHKTIYGVMTFNKNILNNRNESTGSPLDEGDQKSVYERSNYYISFPFDVNVSDIFGFGSYGPDWTLRYYDGKGRAKNGYWADSESFWKWVPPFGTLNAGQGYLLSLNLNNFKTTASFWDNGVENIELYFPATGKIDIRQMDHFDIDSLTKADYESTVWRGRETNTNEGNPNFDRRIADSYWRCIGVPSFAPYKNDSIYNEEDSKIVWTTEANTLPYFYAVNWGDGSLEVKSSAENAIELLPMHGYMVQNKGIIRWHYVSKPVPSSIVARHHNYVQDVEFRLELLKNDIKEDQAFIRLSNNEDVTNAFDFNQDLSKELNEGANIYTLVGMERLAANSMPFSEQTMTIPVGVRIAADGEYTFTIPEGTSGIGVTLIDNVTGARTSMSMTDYTVNLTAGDYNGRFSIEISPVSEVLTDIETVSDEGFEMNGARKVMVDGILYIVKDDIIYDARGNKVQ